MKKHEGSFVRDISLESMSSTILSFCTKNPGALGSWLKVYSFSGALGLSSPMFVATIQFCSSIFLPSQLPSADGVNALYCGVHSTTVVWDQAGTRVVARMVSKRRYTTPMRATRENTKVYSRQKDSRRCFAIRSLMESNDSLNTCMSNFLNKNLI